jgi:hypothetical protein
LTILRRLFADFPGTFVEWSSTVSKSTGEFGELVIEFSK